MEGWKRSKVTVVLWSVYLDEESSIGKGVTENANKSVSCESTVSVASCEISGFMQLCKDATLKPAHIPNIN